MPTDQLEILNPEGRITFYDLDPAKGITNIGRHPDNDIVIDGPHVADFHAVLDHRARPYQLIILAPNGHTFFGGQPVFADAAILLAAWDTLELDGTSIVFLENATEAELAEAEAVEPIAAETPPAAETPGAPAILPLVDAPPSEMARAISLEPAGREFLVDPGQTVICRLTLINTGDRSLALDVQATGLDPAWVAIAPADIRLRPQQSLVAVAAFSPPRSPASRAGPYPVTLVVTSPEHPADQVTADLTLRVQPYFEFTAGELAPKQQTLAWNRPVAQAKFEVANRGNSEAVYRLSGESEQGRARFEFQVPDEPTFQPRQADLRLPAESSASVGVRIVPFHRHLIGFGPHAYFFNITVAPQAGAQTLRSVPGQAHFRPLVGPLPVAIVFALAAILLLIGFRPAIFEFSVAPTQVSAGEEVTLRWSASPFSNLRIDPDVGSVKGPEGAQSIAVNQDVTYTLTADNFLGWVIPGWFRSSRQIRVLVDPVLPGIRFTVDRDQVAVGESVTLAWQVFDANEVVLLVNGVPQTLSSSEFRASRAFVIDRDTTFVLQARNRYTAIDGVSATLVVRVAGIGGAPQATDQATGGLPVIERFDVSPLTVAPGGSVRLEWSVSGVDRVTIEPLSGSFAPSGTLIQAPEVTTAYVLRASNGQAAVSLVRQVTVAAGAGGGEEGQVGAPVIEFLTVTPAQAASGSNVTLAWKVSGDITNIDLAGPGLGSLTGLPAEGTRVVAVTADSLYTLTAFNGELTSVDTVQITVLGATPTLSSLNPSLTSLSPAQAIAGSSSINLTLSGSNFAPGATVQWNGAPRPTTYISANQVTAVISNADLSVAGTVNVTVSNPPPGGVSSSLPFSIQNPLPAISSLNPASVTAGGPGFALEINGSGFNSQSVVSWNGSARVVTSFSGTRLTITVPASDVGTTGTVLISVVNPGPGGGSSSANFTIGEPSPTPSMTPSLTPTATNSPTPTPSLTPTP